MKHNRLDEAPVSAMTYRARKDRSTDELIGICRGILADGEINLAETNFLMGWLRDHQGFRDNFPFNVLYERVEESLVDGVLDLNEQRELLEILHSVVGGEIRGGDVSSLSTWVPFTKPQPDIHFPGNDFVLTGRFVYGERFKVEALISHEGGYVRNNLTLDTAYLVVGTVGSRDWKHSSFGTKIDRALQLRDEKNISISIVSEEHMLDFVSGI